MAIIEVQGIGDVTVPDEWTDQQIDDYIEKEFARANPTRGMSTPQLLAAGVGSALAQTGRGVSQLLGNKQDVASARNRDAPLMDTTAGLIGNIAGHALQTIGPGVALRAAGLPRLGAQLMAPSTLPRAGAIGAGYGGIQEAESGGERLKQAGLGFVGGAAGQKAGQFVAGVTRAGGTAKRAIGEAAERLGFRLTPAQRIGSAPGRLVEHTAESFPVTAGPFHALRNNNQAVANRIAIRAMGLGKEAGDEITDDVLDTAASAAVDKMDAVRAVTNIPLDDALPEIEKAVRSYASKWGRSAPAALRKMLNQAKSAAEDGLTGEEFMAVRRGLSQDSWTILKSPSGDDALGRVYIKVMNALDDAAEKVAPAGVLDDFAKGRRQYANAMLVAKSRQGVDLKLLPKAQREQMRKQLSRGALDDETKDLYTAFQFMDNYRPLVGDSGTASRMVAPVATMGLVTGGAGLHQGALTPEAIMAGAAALPALWGASQAYMRQPAMGLLGNVLGAPAKQAIRAGATGTGVGAGLGFPALLGNR